MPLKRPDKKKKEMKGPGIAQAGKDRLNGPGGMPVGGQVGAKGKKARGGKRSA